MNIEIKGVNFFNKGAELMLLSILKALKGEFPDAVFCATINTGSRALLESSELKVIPYFNSPRFPAIDRLIVQLVELLPSVLVRKMGFVKVSAIDLVLDASGFAYSDQWTYKSVALSAWYFKKVKKSGAKVVLMPQALGPFTSEPIKKHVPEMMKQSDLIFVRDRISLSHLQGLSAGKEPILSPDFTNLLKPDYSKYGELPEGVCIIPNYRMVDMGAGEVYYDFLASVISVLDGSDKDYYFLIHETEVDSKVLKHLEGRIGKSIRSISESNAEKLKAIIGNAEFVIGSRFHGLISALSQAVPVLMTGWSHKYEELSKDYGVEKFLMKDLSSLETVKEITTELIEHRTEISKEIEVRANKIKNEANQMWEKIFNLLRS